MYQKSIENQSKMDQKWTKNRSKLRSGGLQGRFGGLLGRLGRSKGFLRASWIVLEASWKRLGRNKWPTWLQLGLKLAAKTAAKSVLSRPGADFTGIKSFFEACHLGNHFSTEIRLILFLKIKP